MSGKIPEQTNKLSKDLGYEDEPDCSSEATALIRKVGEE